MDRGATEAALTAWCFETDGAAEVASRMLQAPGHHGEHAVRIWGAATATWRTGAPAPSIHVVVPDDREELLSSSLWSLLFGEVFYVPLLQAALGEAPHEQDELGGIAVHQHFVNDVRDRVTCGSSALFVLGSPAAAETISNLVWGQRPTLIALRLAETHLADLRAAYV